MYNNTVPTHRRLLINKKKIPPWFDDNESKTKLCVLFFTLPIVPWELHSSHVFDEHFQKTLKHTNEPRIIADVMLYRRNMINN